MTLSLPLWAARLLHYARPVLSFLLFIFGCVALYRAHGFKEADDFVRATYYLVDGVFCFLMATWRPRDAR